MPKSQDTRLIALSAAFILAAAGSTVSAQDAQPQQTPQTPAEQTQPSDAADAGDQKGEARQVNRAVVAAIKGRPTVTLPGEGAPQSLKVGQVLPQDAIITTNVRDAAVLRVGENQIFTVERLTKVAIAQAFEDTIEETGEPIDRTTLDMPYGDVIFDITSTAAQNDVVVRAPDATLAVRGTFGRISVRGGFPTQAAVDRGTVSFGANVGVQNMVSGGDAADTDTTPAESSEVETVVVIGSDQIAAAEAPPSSGTGTTAPARAVINNPSTASSSRSGTSGSSFQSATQAASSEVTAGQDQIIDPAAPSNPATGEPANPNQPPVSPPPPVTPPPAPPVTPPDSGDGNGGEDPPPFEPPVPMDPMDPVDPFDPGDGGNGGDGGDGGNGGGGGGVVVPPSFTTNEFLDFQFGGPSALRAVRISPPSNRAAGPISPVNAGDGSGGAATQFISPDTLRILYARGSDQIITLDGDFTVGNAFNELLFADVPLSTFASSPPTSTQFQELRRFTEGDFGDPSVAESFGSFTGLGVVGDSIYSVVVDQDDSSLLFDSVLAEVRENGSVAGVASFGEGSGLLALDGSNATGRLYAVGFSTSELTQLGGTTLDSGRIFELDPRSGAVTNILSLGFDPQSVESGDIDASAILTRDSITVDGAAYTRDPVDGRNLLVISAFFNDFDGSTLVYVTVDLDTTSPNNIIRVDSQDTLDISATVGLAGINSVPATSDTLATLSAGDPSQSDRVTIDPFFADLGYTGSVVDDILPFVAEALIEGSADPFAARTAWVNNEGDIQGRLRTALGDNVGVEGGVGAAIFDIRSTLTPGDTFAGSAAVGSVSELLAVDTGVNDTIGVQLPGGSTSLESLMGVNNPQPVGGVATSLFSTTPTSSGTLLLANGGETFGSGNNIQFNDLYETTVDLSIPGVGGGWTLVETFNNAFGLNGSSNAVITGLGALTDSNENQLLFATLSSFDVDGLGLTVGSSRLSILDIGDSADANDGTVTDIASFGTAVELEGLAADSTRGSLFVAGRFTDPNGPNLNEFDNLLLIELEPGDGTRSPYIENVFWGGQGDFDRSASTSTIVSDDFASQGFSEVARIAGVGTVLEGGNFGQSISIGIYDSIDGKSNEGNGLYFVTFNPRGNVVGDDSNPRVRRLDTGEDAGAETFAQPVGFAGSLEANPNFAESDINGARLGGDRLTPAQVAEANIDPLFARTAFSQEAAQTPAFQAIFTEEFVRGSSDPGFCRVNALLTMVPQTLMDNVNRVDGTGAAALDLRQQAGPQHPCSSGAGGQIIIPSGE